MTIDGRHYFLGINEKQFFPVPSFAIRGSCFPSEGFDQDSIRDYVFAILDAVGFDWGMAHIELIVTANGPMLVEVNPRLVGAKIPRLLNLAFERSIHSDLIALHLGELQDFSFIPTHYAVSRWFVAEQYGVLTKLDLPKMPDPQVRCVEIVKKTGALVHSPYTNGDRIGYVMVTATDRASTESIAEKFISNVHLEVTP